MFVVKFVYSEKATKFWEISTLLLSTVHTDKSKVEILPNFVAFSEYMNFNNNLARCFNMYMKNSGKLFNFNSYYKTRCWVNASSTASVYYVLKVW